VRECLKVALSLQLEWRCGDADGEIDQLYKDQISKIIGDTLLMASPAEGAAIARPFSSVDTVVQSIRKLLSGYQEAAIWKEVRTHAFSHAHMLWAPMCA